MDSEYQFPDPYDPFAVPFAEYVWIDSVSEGIDTADFIGIKIGDVNGSFFHSFTGTDEIERRSDNAYFLVADINDGMANLKVKPGQGLVDGFQMSISTGYLTAAQIESIHSDILGEENWWYDASAGAIHISWNQEESRDIEGSTILGYQASSVSAMQIIRSEIEAEAYQSVGSGYEIRGLAIEKSQHPDVFTYELLQNEPNPFMTAAW